MQVGDLVELSSAGRKSQQNMAVFGKFGMIIEVNHRAQYPYSVEWYGTEQRIDYKGVQGVLPCKRYELKLMRAKK